MKQQPLSGKSPSSGNTVRTGITAIIAWFSLLLLLIPVSAWSQLNEGGSPYSTFYPVELLGIPVLVLEVPDIHQITQEDDVNPVPYRFAVNVPVDAGIGPPAGSDAAPAGRWQKLPGGDRMWTLRIHAPGAKALTLYFDRFRLPDGGRLFVYNPERTRVLGAFTPGNNSPGGRFSTELIPGEELVVEYNQPASSAELPDLHIAEVAWAYRGVPDANGERGFGSSGPCEVNVNCSEGDLWRDQQKGITRISVKKYGSTYWCSGSLINNTRLDQTPYLFTADHCGKGATPQDIHEWIFYFDYESAGCPNPSVQPTSRSMTGATLKATAGDVNVSGSDFLLLLLDQTIPDTFDVWFNGWNRSGLSSPQGVGIHHPQGDIKKISTYTDSLRSVGWRGYLAQTHWRVRWAGTLNGHGVTEGGSSGSPVFDPEGRITGALTGGESSCDSSALTLPDYYGKFSWSWDQNGADSAKRLDCWLDPDRTGVLFLDGLALSVQEPDPISEKLRIYPNPARETISISSPHFSPSRNWSVVIVDTFGRDAQEVSDRQGVQGIIRLDISPLPHGFYLVRFRSDELMLTGRIMKL